MSDSTDVRVIIDGMGLKFEGQVTFRQAVEMLRIASVPAVSFPDVPQLAGQPPAASAKSGIKDYALSELVNELEPASSAETIAIIASWVLETEELEAVTRQNVRDRYQEARLAPPSNFPRDFKTAISKGLLAQVKGEKDRFYVTRTGRKLLERNGD